MPAETQIDPASNAAQSTLDSLFGTLSKGIGLWGQIQTDKLALAQQKAAIPATVAYPTPSPDGTTLGGLSGKTWAIIGGSVAGLVLLLVLLVRRRS